jgi:hypothetical protein
MDASKEACPTKFVLMSAWQSAAEIYSKTVAELSHKIGVLPKADYEKLSRLADEARKRSIQAQKDLEAHMAEHGCDGKDEAVA